jgi:hypothetical protein
VANPTPWYRTVLRKVGRVIRTSLPRGDRGGVLLQLFVVVAVIAVAVVALMAAAMATIGS